MKLDLMFFVNSVLLGVGLAMDAFSVSLANGLNEPKMRPVKTIAVSGVFSLFQFAMPLLGWYLVTTFLSFFKVFETFIPYIALVLLCFIGGKMLYESLSCKCQEEECCKKKVSFISLIVQGIATSIDALSVGFTTSEYNFLMAFISSLIIGVVTFIICLAGVNIGKKFGTHLSNKAGILGGIILIVIGIEIFISSLI